MIVSSWANCYDDQWRDLIVPEAFSHPAKFSPGLIRRIFDHGLDKSYWKPGDLIGDPFGGIAGGGINAAYAKLNWIGVELEEKFVSLGNQNIDLHRSAWESYGFPVPVLIQGDSRRFSEIVQAHGIVTSPPYAEGLSKEHTYQDHEKREAGARRNIYGEKGIRDPFYGNSQGQIGALKSGDLAGVVTSPPYADSVNSQQHGIDWTKAGPATGNRKRGEGCKHESTFKSQLNYSADPSNIGNLKMDGLVTSPPFESSTQVNENPKDMTAGKALWAGGADSGARCKQNYHNPDSDGQIGKGSGETYWQAMAKVYLECFKALKPGGYMAVVIKDYVKNKRRVPLCMQTLKLLIHTGFEPVERIKAMLVKEDRQPGLFGVDIVTKKERKSFFRRLAEKNGSQRIDWEEVLIVRK